MNNKYYDCTFLFSIIIHPCNSHEEIRRIMQITIDHNYASCNSHEEISRIMQITIDHNYASCNSHDEARQNNLYCRSVSIITDHEYNRNASLLLYVSQHILPKARTIKLYDDPSSKTYLFHSDVWTASHDSAGSHFPHRERT